MPFGETSLDSSLEIPQTLVEYETDSEVDDLADERRYLNTERKLFLRAALQLLDERDILLSGTGQFQSSNLLNRSSFRSDVIRFGRLKKANRRNALTSMAPRVWKSKVVEIKFGIFYYEDECITKNDLVENIWRKSIPLNATTTTVREVRVKGVHENCIFQLATAGGGKRTFLAATPMDRDAWVRGIVTAMISPTSPLHLSMSPPAVAAISNNTNSNQKTEIDSKQFTALPSPLSTSAAASTQAQLQTQVTSHIQANASTQVSPPQLPTSTPGSAVAQSLGGKRHSFNFLFKKNVKGDNLASQAAANSLPAADLLLQSTCSALPGPAAKYAADIAHYCDEQTKLAAAANAEEYQTVIQGLRDHNERVRVPVFFVKQVVRSHAEEAGDFALAPEDTLSQSTVVTLSSSQVWKDLQRDRVCVNGELIIGESRGVDGIVAALTRHIMTAAEQSRRLHGHGAKSSKASSRNISPRAASSVPFSGGNSPGKDHSREQSNSRDHFLGGGYLSRLSKMLTPHAEDAEEDETGTSDFALSEAHALACARDVLVLCNRTQSGGDTYFCLESFLAKCGAESHAADRLCVLTPLETVADPLRITVDVCSLIPGSGDVAPESFETTSSISGTTPTTTLQTVTPSSPPALLDSANVNLQRNMIRRSQSEGDSQYSMSTSSQSSKMFGGGTIPGFGGFRSPLRVSSESVAKAFGPAIGLNDVSPRSDTDMSQTAIVESVTSTTGIGVASTSALPVPEAKERSRSTAGAMIIPFKQKILSSLTSSGHAPVHPHSIQIDDITTEFISPMHAAHQSQGQFSPAADVVKELMLSPKSETIADDLDNEQWHGDEQDERLMASTINELNGFPNRLSSATLISAASSDADLASSQERAVTAIGVAMGPAGFTDARGRFTDVQEVLDADDLFNSDELNIVEIGNNENDNDNDDESVSTNPSTESAEIEDDDLSVVSMEADTEDLLGIDDHSTIPRQSDFPRPIDNNQGHLEEFATPLMMSRGSQSAKSYGETTSSEQQLDDDYSRKQNGSGSIRVPLSTVNPRRKKDKGHERSKSLIIPSVSEQIQQAVQRNQPTTMTPQVTATTGANSGGVIMEYDTKPRITGISLFKSKSFKLFDGTLKFPGHVSHDRDHSLHSSSTLSGASITGGTHLHGVSFRIGHGSHNSDSHSHTTVERPSESVHRRKSTLSSIYEAQLSSLGHARQPELAIRVVVKAETHYRICCADPQGDESDNWATVTAVFKQSFLVHGGVQGSLTSLDRVVTLQFDRDISTVANA